MRTCFVKASGCASLVSCLPALERVVLVLSLLTRDDLGGLLEALAWCPRLRALDLSVECFASSEGDLHWPLPYASAFAKLSSLTKLGLEFDEEEPFTLADVVGALVPLTGLVELDLRLHQPAVLPAALGQFKLLQSLAFQSFGTCVLEAGCLDLPSLLSLKFEDCIFEENAEVLPGVSALQRLTRIEMSGDEGPRFFDPGVVHVPALQLLVLSCGLPDDDDEDEGVDSCAPARPLRLPADMGLLSLSLMHLNIRGLRLPQFPLALTQLVALECLHANGNEFAELPAGITALSRMKELKLGRVHCFDNHLQLHEKCPLNAVALGDLSGFPALCKLTFSFCEVKLCKSLLGGAVRHASLACIFLHFAHPAPESVPVMLQLSQDLRSGVLKLPGDDGSWDDCPAPALPPFYKFKAALELCAL